MDKHPAEVTTKTITIEVGQNVQGMNEDIRWTADDLKEGHRTSKAMFLTLFDRETKETMKIDLWTKDLMVMEMDRMVYYSLRALADTYFKSSQNKELAGQMQQFANFFGEQTEIVPRNE